MSRDVKGLVCLLFLLIVGVLLFNPVFRMFSSATSLGEGYLFLERMQVETETDMILMFTPSSDFNQGDNIRELRILFPETQGEWCQAAAGSLTVAGVSSSPVDSATWNIDAALPDFDGGNTLEAICYQGGAGENDYIKIINIGPLTGEQSYGVKIDENATSFKTGPNSGSNLVSLQLQEGTKTETISFEINLTALGEDRLVVEAEVVDINTITCNVSSSSISFGSLPRDGSYVTREHSLAADSSHENGYYWAVFGQGNGTIAGLWKNTIPTSLIPSSGSTTIDLSKNHGFGLSASSASGTIPANFSHPNAAVFGAINSGQSNSRLIYQSSESGPSNVSITLGARAGAFAEVGPYTETLTYLCGGLY